MIEFLRRKLIMFLMGKEKCCECNVFCEWFEVCEAEVLFEKFPCKYLNKKESRGKKNGIKTC